MTWDARDLRKNKDPVSPELLKDLGAAPPEVGDKTPYEALLDSAFEEQAFGMDAPLVQRVPMHLQSAFASYGLQTEAMWQSKKRYYTRGVIPESGLEDPSLYSE